MTRIVHLAALLSEDVRTDELAATKVNALGTNNVFEAARLCSEQIESVVVTSSEAVYGTGPDLASSGRVRHLSWEVEVTSSGLPKGRP